MYKNMLLVSSAWKDKPTFKLIPVSNDCPYNEIIFDPEVNVLAIISKEKKESYHILPRLTEHGDVMKVNAAKRDHNKPYAEQRVALDTYYEYFIKEQSQIEDIIGLFATNDDIFDYKSILNESFSQPSPDPVLN